MFFYEGYSCPVCGKAFVESDDVVACPSCGAPHHRDCWKQEGHCHFADRHGTPDQWSREQQASYSHQENDSATDVQSNNANTTIYTVCPHCGQNNSVFAEFCSRCGRELQASDWTSGPAHNTRPPEPPFPPFGDGYREYRPFQTYPTPHSAVPDDMDLDGLSAGELSRFVGQNTHYYMLRFLKMAQNGSSVSWNWAAFLLTPYWLWYRKQYVAGSLVMLFQIFSRAIIAFFLYGYIGLGAGSTYDAVSDALMRVMDNSTTMYWILALYLLMFLEFFLHLVFGMLGNRFYYRLAHRRIRRSKEKSPFVPAANIGGVSFILGVTAYLITYFLSAMINLLFL